ncbi:MAG TPA: O-antigen ligase family protein [Vicinamibacterales bacterium]|nr:O-antigen ligase family protein [Vicinamibacterales bacterium]
MSDLAGGSSMTGLGLRAPAARLASVVLPTRPPSQGSTGRVLASALACVAGVCLMAWLAVSFDPLLALGALVALGGGVLMLVRPELATTLTVFLLYLNVPAILTQRYGMPEVVAGAFILLLASPLLHRLFVRREPLLFDSTFLLMLVFLAVMLASSMLSRDPGLALTRVQVFVLEGLLLYWLVVNAVGSLRALRQVLCALLVAGALLASLSLYQQVTGNFDQEFGGLAYRNYVEEGLEAPPRGGRDWLRAQGPVNEPNRFGQILLVLVPLAVFLYRTGASRSVKLLAAAAGLALLVGIGLTSSRGTFIALAMVAASMVAVRWVRASRLLLAAGVLLLALPLASPFLLMRIQSIAGVTKLLGGERAAYQDLDGATLGRTTEMLAAFSAFLDHPVLGVGPGLYTPLYSVEYQQKNPDLKFRDLRVPRRAHTLYFEMAAELGAVGLTVFMAIVLMLARRLWLARKRLLERWRDRSDLATAMLLTLFAYLATAVTMHLAYQRYYWLLLALASAALHILHAGQREEERTWRPSRS